MIVERIHPTRNAKGSMIAMKEFRCSTFLSDGAIYQHNIANLVLSLGTLAILTTFLTSLDDQHALSYDFTDGR